MTKFYSGFIRCFACLNGQVPTVDKEFACQQEADNREDRYAVAIYGDTQSSTVHACTVFGHLPRQISCVSFMFMFMEHDSTITGRETGNLSQLASNSSKTFP